MLFFYIVLFKKIKSYGQLEYSLDFNYIFSLSEKASEMYMFVSFNLTLSLLLFLFLVYMNAHINDVIGIVHRIPMLPTSVCNISVTIISRFKSARSGGLYAISKSTKESELPI